MKFASSKFEPAQQGDLDGFCGVYSVLNFFFRRHASQRADALLEAGDLDGHGMFKAILERIEALEQMMPTGSVQ